MDLLVVTGLVVMQEMSLFFRGAVGNIWEGNVMMSGMSFRILLQNEANMLKIYMFYLIYFHRCEHFNKKENVKLQAGKYATGIPASLRLAA